MKQQLEKLLLQAESFMGKNMTDSDPQFKAWKSSVIRFCENVYGPDASTTVTFKKRLYGPMVLVGDTPHSTFVKFFERDMATSIEELKNLISEIGLYDNSSSNKANEFTQVPNFNFNINNSSNNSNINNTSNIIEVLSVDIIKEKIEDNTFINDSEKEELLLKLDEIKEISESTLSRPKKWERAKAILAFVLDKGVDIAIMFIPQILKMLQ